MRKKTTPLLVFVVLAFTFLAVTDALAAFKADSLLGKQTLNFNLSSTEDRPIAYSQDYQEKYYLIITFFPAAFTPI
ncbi:MAG TPA: hypothetical protein P5551_08795 [Syntrophales bacterium]|jgi:hypothetical protein|nr:hypothetical protein [Syntrophales bacterium]